METPNPQVRDVGTPQLANAAVPRYKNFIEAMRGIEAECRFVR